MTLTEDELARPLTAEEEATLREWVRRGHKPWTYGADGVLTGHIDRLLATLDATRKAADGAYEAGKLDAEGEYHDRDTPVADTAGIDAAWREAEAALPEGYGVSVSKTVNVSAGQYVATTDYGEPRDGYAYADSPAAALLALAAALRTPKPEGDVVK